MRAGKDCGWWTRSQSIRTEGAKPSVAPKSRSYCCDEERRMEVPFEVALVDSPVVPTCMGIAEKTLHLKELNMNPNRIAVALKVDRTTVTRALRWILTRGKGFLVGTRNSCRSAGHTMSPHPGTALLNSS